MRRLVPCLLLLAVLAACGAGSPGPSRKGPAQAASLPPWVGVELQRGRDPREVVRIGLRGATIGPASGALAWQLFATPRRAADAWYFLYTYAPFTRSTPEGDLVFRGRGKVQAGPVQQRMIFEWARQVAAEAAGGRGAAVYGLLLAWHQGGTSGICEDTVLYLTGEAVATACGWEGEVRGRLDPGQLDRVYGWFDRLKPFQVAGGPSEDSPRPGALDTRVIFAGRGGRAATESEQAEIRSFAASLFAELAARRRGGAPAPAQAGGSGSAAAAVTETLAQRLLLPPGAAAPRREEVLLQLPEKPPPVPKVRPWEQVPAPQAP